MLFIYRSVYRVVYLCVRLDGQHGMEGEDTQSCYRYIRSETPTLLSSRRLSWFIFTLRATPTERTENDEERETDKKK